MKAKVAVSQPGGLSDEDNIAQTEPQEQCPAQAEGEGAARPGEAVAGRPVAPGVRGGQGPLRDRGADQRDELRGHRRGPGAGVQARAGRGDQPAADAAEEAPAVPRVGPCAEHRLQPAVRRHAAGGPGQPAQQRGLHGRPGGGGGPEPDGGGRFHAALRRGGRRRAAGGLQRGAAAVVAGPGPGPAGPGGLRGRGRDAGATCSA